jgi:multiple sugar transport system substrate-binding protein
MELRVPILIVASLAGITALVGTELAAKRQHISDRIVVTYWEKWTGDEMSAMKEVVDAFNASQDRILVQCLSISGVAEKTLLATSGGNPPDVAGLWADQVVQFADAGALEDLSEMGKEAGIGEKDYIPAYWRMLNYRGKLYALPTSPGCAAIYVNKDLVGSKYDTPEEFPTTISQFDEFVTSVSDVGDSGELKKAAFLPRDGWGLWAIPYLFGGSFTEGDKINVNGKDDLIGWKWVNTFAKRFGTRETQAFRSGFGNYSSPQNPFLSGKLATYADGPWFANFIRLYNPNVNWFVVPFPYPDGRKDLAGYTMLNLNTLMIPKGAVRKKEAFEFIKFVQNQKVMERLCMRQYCNTPLREVSQNFIDNHPNKFISVFDKLARSENAVRPLQMGVAAQVGREIGIAVDQMDLGLKEPQKALDEAQLRLEGLWDKYQRQVLGQ